MKTVDAIRFVTGYFITYPKICEGLDMDDSIAAAMNTFVGHGWKTMLYEWDVSDEEASQLVEIGKWRCGVIDHPYAKPIKTVGKTRHMTDSELLGDLLFED